MSRKHAILSASSSKRWMTCTPSARLTECYEDETSEYAKQGTEAHALCEYKLRRLLKSSDEPTPIPGFQYFDDEMDRCSDAYVSFVAEVLKAAEKRCKDPLVLIETRVDYSRYVPEGFGTADAIIVADGTMAVIDFKYGQGVVVDANNNPQMMLYSLGALEIFDGLYNIDTVEMVIFQPRRENISTFKISVKDLLDWANNELRPKARMAWNGEGNLVAGENCRFCKVKATCRKRAEIYQELARHEFQDPPLLSNDEISEIINKAKLVREWLTDIEEYALSEATKGVKFKGYKLVEGRSNRKYRDESEVAKAVTAAGYDPYVKKLRTITDMTKHLGKDAFSEIVEPLLIKPSGKPTFVPEEDKRPETTLAQIDFKDL